MYYIGIDVGGTKIKAGLVREDGTIAEKCEIDTGARRPAEEIAADISALAKKLAGDKKSEIRAIGIGLPGSVSNKTGEVLFTPNVNFERFPLAGVVEKEVGIPVFLANDADCAALGEYMHLSEKVENMILVTLGTGIGGGMILGGKLYTGSNGTAGEIGHSMVRLGDRECSCGRRGCWETYSSVTALISDTRRFAEENPESNLRKALGENFENLSGKSAFDLAKQGDKDAQKIVDTWISYVAEGVTDLINILQPEVLLIGGGISREGEFLLAPLRKLVAEKIYKSGAPVPEIRAAAMGNDAGLLGAAFLFKE